jgi:hypothetical protein
MFIDYSIHLPCQKTRKLRGQMSKFRVSKEAVNENLLLRKKEGLGEATTC